MSRYLIINADDFGYNPQQTRAIDELFSEGLISSTSLMSVAPDSKNAAEIAKNKNLNVKNKILKFELKTPSNKVKEYLQLEDTDSLVFQIERIRFIDDEPTILEKIYIPEYMCPSLSEYLVSNNSIYKLYREKYLHKTQIAKQVINPIILNKSQSKTLNVDSNTLALKIDRVVFTDKDEVLEYTSSLFITDKHQYEIILNED